MARKRIAGKEHTMTLGLNSFARISAVEGVRLSDAAVKEFREDESRKASAHERRERIIAKYARS